MIFCWSLKCQVLSQESYLKKNKVIIKLITFDLLLPFRFN
jgi:hypothetical protein